MFRPLLFIALFMFCGAMPAVAAPAPPGQPPLDQAVVNAAADIAANLELLQKAYAQPPAFISDYRLNLLLCREMGTQPAAFVDLMIRVQGDPVLWCHPMIRHGGPKAEVSAWAERATSAFSALGPGDERQEQMRARCLKAVAGIQNGLR